MRTQTRGWDQFAASPPLHPVSAGTWHEPASRLGFWAASLTAIVVALSLVPWILGAVGASALLAVQFWRGGRRTA